MNKTFKEYKALFQYESLITVVIVMIINHQIFGDVDYILQYIDLAREVYLSVYSWANLKVNCKIEIWMSNMPLVSHCIYLIDSAVVFHKKNIKIYPTCSVFFSLSTTGTDVPGITDISEIMASTKLAGVTS